jgi:hypothetical protein
LLGQAAAAAALDLVTGQQGVQKAYATSCANHGLLCLCVLAVCLFAAEGQQAAEAAQQQEEDASHSGNQVRCNTNQQASSALWPATTQLLVLQLKQQ